MVPYAVPKKPKEPARQDHLLWTPCVHTLERNTVLAQKERHSMSPTPQLYIQRVVPSNGCSGVKAERHKTSRGSLDIDAGAMILRFKISWFLYDNLLYQGIVASSTASA